MTSSIEIPPVGIVIGLIVLAFIALGICRSYFVARIEDQYFEADDLMRDWQRLHPTQRIDDFPSGRRLIQERNALWEKHQLIDGCKKDTLLGFLLSLLPL